MTEFINRFYKPSKKTHEHLYINFPQICKYSGAIIHNLTCDNKSRTVSSDLLKGSHFWLNGWFGKVLSFSHWQIYLIKRISIFWGEYIYQWASYLQTLKHEVRFFFKTKYLFQLVTISQDIEIFENTFSGLRCLNSR